MAAPSLTFTLTNGTSADASQVMQNFNDLLNGITDGTKDLSISALTCAGTATLNGHVNLGNSSADDLTITASLAADLVPKTDGAQNIGSAAKGLASVYFGDGSGDTARIVPATLAADRTYTLPDAGAAADFVMTAGSQTIAGAKTFSTQLIGFGTATNDSAAAGYIGEYLVGSNISATNYAATGVWGNYTSITLTAGDWDLSITSQATIGAGGTQTYFEIGISTESTSTSFTDGTYGVNKIGQLPPTSSADSSAFISSYRVSISAGNTYYMKFRAGWATTNPTLRAQFSARRVR